MKKIILTLCVATMATMGASARELNVGVNALYGTKIENAGFGVKLQTGFAGNFRWEVSYDHFLKRDYHRMQDANLNLQYVIKIPFVKWFKLYPLVGVTYSNYRVPSNDEYGMPDHNKGDKKHNYFGANIGVGAQAKLVGPLWLNVDLKGQIIKTSQFVPNVGLMLCL